MSTTSAIEPLEGRTTSDDRTFFEPERLCYASAAAVARRIASDAWPHVNGKRVVVAGEDILVDFANLQAAIVSLHALQQEYLAIAAAGESLSQSRGDRVEGTESAGAALAAVALPALAPMFTPLTAGVSAALGLVSLFREDVEFRGIRTVVDPLAFELVLAQMLQQFGRASEVFVPELIVVTQQVGNDSLRARLQAVHVAKARAWSAAGPLISELVALDTQLDRAARMQDAAAVAGLSVEVAQLRRDLEPVSEPLGRADQRLSELETSWATREERTGLTQLARLLRAEAIQDMKAVLIHAKVVSSGGHHRITRSLWRTAFLGDGVTANGGAVVRWGVLAASGAVLIAGLEHESQEDKVGARGWFRRWRRQAAPAVRRQDGSG
jgi:hypothetical protein